MGQGSGVGLTPLNGGLWALSCHEGQPIWLCCIHQITSDQHQCLAAYPHLVELGKEVRVHEQSA